MPVNSVITGLFITEFTVFDRLKQIKFSSDNGTLPPPAGLVSSLNGNSNVSTHTYITYNCKIRNAFYRHMGIYGYSSINFLNPVTILAMVIK
ncbi:hypothetical protein BEL04_21145 [Mucilaginibacter sp. PPCGB 2223]|nr:hypothetical protein BEL04_21145 [Mucilaginibacter sp. PPCGB 2223]